MNDIIERLSRLKAVETKSLQRGEEEPTATEKFVFLEKLLEKSCNLFIEKYGKNMKENELRDFMAYAKDRKEELAVYIAEQCIDNTFTPSTLHMGKKNRRVTYLEKNQHEYFSDVHMRELDSSVYEEYIGQYLSARERKALLGNCDADVKTPRLSDFMIRHVLKNNSDNSVNLDETTVEVHSTTHSSSIVDSQKQIDKVVLDEELRLSLRMECIDVFRQRFLTGKEVGFDYAQVDECVNLDHCGEAYRDSQYRYFQDA